MKLSSTTIDILKNYSMINPSLLIKPGNQLRTMTPQRTILADAVVEEEFPQTVRIYNLSALLSIMSLFKEPDFDFQEKLVTISEGNRKTDFYYAEEGMIVEPREDAIELGDATVEVVVPWSDLSSVIKAAGAFQFQTIALIGEEGKVFLRAIDPERKNRATDTFGVEVGHTNDTFQQVIDIETLKLMQGDYTIRLSPRGLASFTNDNMVYFVPIKANESNYTRGE